MSILPVRFFGDPVLKEKSTPLGEINIKSQKLAINMAETMYESSGVGLAAPQVGIPKRIIVVDFGDNNFVAYVNPEITYYSDKEEVEEEGCLCLPDVRVPVKRSLKIGFKALDLKGRPVEIDAENFLARILQHEVDHLDGKIILDRTSPEDRQKAVRQIMEMYEQLRNDK